MPRLTIAIVVVLVALVGTSRAFLAAPTSHQSNCFRLAAASKRDPSTEEPHKQGGFFGAIGGFFEELDAFMDDASYVTFVASCETRYICCVDRLSPRCYVDVTLNLQLPVPDDWGTGPPFMGSGGPTSTVNKTRTRSATAKSSTRPRITKGRRPRDSSSGCRYVEE